MLFVEAIKSFFLGIIEYVKEIITDCGFLVNDNKIRLYKEYGNKFKYIWLVNNKNNSKSCYFFNGREDRI